MTDTPNLAVDPDRKGYQMTGIYCRALVDGRRFRNVDIASLTPDSLLRYLRQHGGSNPFAEDIVGLLVLGQHIVPKPSREDPEP